MSTLLPAIQEVLQNGGRVATLDLRGISIPMQAQNNRRMTDADAQTVADLLSTGKIVCDVVDVQVGNLTDVGAKVLTESCAKAGVLGINLRANEITAIGAKSIVEAFKKCDSIQSITLDANALGDDGIHAIAELLSANPPSLSHVSLCRTACGASGLISLAAALHTGEARIQSLDISEPRLSSRNEETTHHIARALRNNSTLRQLSMRKTPHLVDSGIEAILDAILDSTAKNKCVLASLDLSQNKLGPPSGVRLAAALEQGAPFEILTLPHCRVADEGAVALAKVIASGACPQLRVLDLRFNDIGDEGLVALAEALLSESCSLEILRLWGNRLVPAAVGTTAIGKAMLSGAVRTAVDCTAYEVDGQIHVGEESI